MTVQEFCGSLFELHTTVHIAHLQTTSFAQHMALNELYENIVGLRDRFIEGFQGRNLTIIKGYKITVQAEGIDMLKYLVDLSNKYKEYQATLKDSFLQQVLDDILDLINGTIYKLKFLK